MGRGLGSLPQVSEGAARHSVEKLFGRCASQREGRGVGGPLGVDGQVSVHELVTEEQTVVTPLRGAHTRSGDQIPDEVLFAAELCRSGHAVDFPKGRAGWNRLQLVEEVGSRPLVRKLDLASWMEPQRERENRFFDFGTVLTGLSELRQADFLDVVGRCGKLGRQGDEGSFGDGGNVV